MRFEVGGRARNLPNPHTGEVVGARVFRCGCLSAHAIAQASVLAEATYCREGLRLARALKARRDLLRGTDFADGRWADRFARLEETEARLHAHRLNSVIFHRARRPPRPSQAGRGGPEVEPRFQKDGPMTSAHEKPRLPGRGSSLAPFRPGQHCDISRGRGDRVRMRSRHDAESVLKRLSRTIVSRVQARGLLLSLSPPALAFAGATPQRTRAFPFFLSLQ